MRQGGKSLCTFNEPMSSPNTVMCPILKSPLLGFPTELRTRGAAEYEALRKILLIIGANLIAG